MHQVNHTHITQASLMHAYAVQFAVMNRGSLRRPVAALPSVTDSTADAGPVMAQSCGYWDETKDLRVSASILNCLTPLQAEPVNY